MILRVDGDAGGLSHDPIVRQRFRPGGIDLELRQVVAKGRRDRKRASKKRRSNFHESLRAPAIAGRHCADDRFQYAAIKEYAVQYGRGQPSPISRKISAVCCPRRGDGCSEPAFQPSMTIGVRTPGMVPALAEPLGNSNFMPRWTTCGSLNTCLRLLIGPAGTCCASS